MAAKDLLHSDQIPASRLVGQNLRFAKEGGYLTDQNVADATTDDSLKANILAAVVHADAEPPKGRVNKIIETGDDDGTLNDTDVQAATTVFGLANSATHSAPGKIGPLGVD